MEGYVADERDARHEAAHAVVAHYMGRPVLFINIDTHLSTVSGNAKIETPGRANHQDAPYGDLRAASFGLLSGHIAEHVQEDLSGLHPGQVGRIVAENVLDETRAGKTDSNSDLPKLASLLISHFPPQNHHLRDILVTKWALQTECLLVTTLWPPIIAVAKQLYQQKTMTGAEFNIVIAPFVASGVLPSHAGA